MDKNKPSLFQHYFKNLNEALFGFELKQMGWNAILEIDLKQIINLLNFYNNF